MNPRGAIALALIVVLALTGCVVGGHGSGVVKARPSHGQLTSFAAVGDSLSAGCTDIPRTTPDECSWIKTAEENPELAYVGGWVQRGATSTLMAASVRPVHADVLVILAGTNNVLTGVPLDQLERDFDSIVETVQAGRVLALAIPPIDTKAETTAVRDTNAFVKLLAQERGWFYFDPWLAYRAKDESWTLGSAPDGVHPIEAIQVAAGMRIAAHMVAITD